MFTKCAPGGVCTVQPGSQVIIANPGDLTPLLRFVTTSFMGLVTTEHSRYDMSSKSLNWLILLSLLGSTLMGAATWAETKSAAADKKPAAQAEPPKEQLAEVLAPSQFFGGAAMGYAAAKAIPEVCSKIFCYCGCDITDGHNCLLDCFTSRHGVDCHICQEESLQALRMHRDEEPLVNIQKNIDENYSNRYPFKEESPALKKYKATRLWTQSKSSESTSKAADTSDSCCARK